VEPARFDMAFGLLSTLTVATSLMGQDQKG